MSNIQDYFEYVLKSHGVNIDIPSIRIYVNKIKNKITFKIKTGLCLELLAPETIKLLRSTENKITKIKIYQCTNKNGENVPHLEITEVILVHCNIGNNDYQQGSRVFSKFVPNKPFVSLLEIHSKNHIFLKTFNSELEVWSTDQNSQPFETEDRINLTVIIK